MATDIIVGQLLENAIKYSPEGGAVCVRARVTGDWIEVTVEDEGIGIADGDHERIFDRFFQGEAGDRRAPRLASCNTRQYFHQGLNHRSGRSA